MQSSQLQKCHMVMHKPVTDTSSGQDYACIGAQQYSEVLRMVSFCAVACCCIA